eukprot:9826440-Heterocapsa_arctica.AAC.1
MPFVFLVAHVLVLVEPLLDLVLQISPGRLALQHPRSFEASDHDQHDFPCLVCVRAFPDVHEELLLVGVVAVLRVAVSDMVSKGE